jgi:hypothetical protein
MKTVAETTCMYCGRFQLKKPDTGYIPPMLAAGVARVKALDKIDRFLNE